MESRFVPEGAYVGLRNDNEDDKYPNIYIYIYI